MKIRMSNISKIFVPISRKMAQDCHTIELDCPPGPTRPNDCLIVVLEGTGLTSEDFTITSKFFGAWTFELLPGKDDTYTKASSLIGQRVKTLHNQGTIRYGSW